MSIGVRPGKEIRTQFLSAEDLGVRVQAEENSLVDQGVLLLSPGSFLGFGVGETNDGLDFGAVDKTGDIGVGDLGGRKARDAMLRWRYGRKGLYLHVILFVGRRGVKGSKDLVEKGERRLCPDDEAAKMTTGGELEEVESLDVGKFDTGEVAEGLYDAIVFVVDDEGAAALAVATVAHLTLSGAKFARVGDLDDVGVGVDALQEGDSLLGLLQGFDVGRDDERDLGDLFDAVTTGKNEGREGRGSERGDGSEATLVLVYFDVPLAPSFGGGEHATTTAHVTKGGLGE